ncbi:MAG TPA: hypothetical protein VIJ94_15725 [Caulobacteraceae bacterium]
MASAEAKAAKAARKGSPTALPADQLDATTRPLGKGADATDGPVAQARAEGRSIKPE